MSRRRIAQGISASWVRFGVSIAVGLFQLPILYANLSKPALGLYLLFFTVSAFLSLVDLGLGSVLGRAVSYVKGKADAAAGEDGLAGYRSASISDMVWSGFAAYGISSLVMFGVGLGIGPALIASAGLPAGLQAEAWLAWVLFLAGVSCNLLSAVPFSCLNGFGDVGWEQASRTVLQVVRLAGIAAIAPQTHSIAALCALDLALNVASIAGSLLLLKLRHRQALSEPGRARGWLMKRMVTEATPVFVTRLGALMILETTPLVVAATRGVASVPDFMALKQLSSFGLALPNAIPVAVAPFATAAFSAGDHQKVREYHGFATRLSLVLAMLWLVGFLVWAPSLTDFWLGKGHFLGYAVAAPLAIAALLEAHHSAHGYFAWSTGKWPFAPWAIAGGVLTLGFSIAGGHVLGLGGIALGGLLAQLFTNNWYTIYYTLRRLDLRVSDYLRHSLAPVLLQGILLACVAAGSAHWLGGAWASGWSLRGVEGGKLVSMLLGGFTTTLVCGLTSWHLILTANERQLLRTALLRGRPTEARS
ncbi:hypothetical protein J7643_15100 [bacterium]|nr:hypothetical protein [bacterium]